MPPVVECDIPAASCLDPDFVAAAYFRECYRTAMARPTPDVIDVFFAILGHHLAWLKLILGARHRLASWAGLAAPKPADVFKIERKPIYAVGDVIGVWPVFALTERELIAGRDNRHLDFRVSILKEAVGDAGAVVYVSTICVTHNWFGKAYLSCV